MKRRLRPQVKIVGIIIIVLVVCFTIYMLGTSKVNNNEDIIQFDVNSGSTYNSIAQSLKDKKLIRSVLFYKIYIKLSNPSSLQVGRYKLRSNMNLYEIVDVLSSGSTYNPNNINITIPEGKHLDEIATIVSNFTNNTKDSILSVWTDKDFVNDVIDKYWFITDDVNRNGIRYPLEGYLFPSTYAFSNKDVTPKEVAYKMLDTMDAVLSKYKDDINSSEYSVHEILTMASIIEHEAILDSDRFSIAGVFYNRLKIGMKLQSCATLGYATGEWKLRYTYSDMAIESPYNTYLNYGLPIGPGDMPGEESIKAAIYPEDNNYYYFMANVCDPNDNKTYFSETYKQHESYVSRYLTCA